jgi:thioredoxin 1
MSIMRWGPTDVAAAIADGGVVLVDLRSPSCPRCGPQEQVLERIAPSYHGHVTIASVDVVEHPELADDYGVQGVPTHLVFARGELKHTVAGFRRAPELTELLDKTIAAQQRGDDVKAGA